MDQATQQRLDSVLEAELHRGFRIKELPEELQAEMVADGLVPMARVRFTRLNPRRKAKIATEVQRRYHADLKNPDILSNDQIAKLVEERGEWTPEMTRRMFTLVEDTQSLQGELYAEGIGHADWGQELTEVRSTLEAALTSADFANPEDRDRTLHQLVRWAEFAPSLQSAYSVLYAAEQGRETYSVDKDYSDLTEAMPSVEALAALERLDDLRDKAIRFAELRNLRVELAALQNKHTRIFADSVESRRDQAEEMARVYFCSERVGEDDAPTGPLAATFDALWDLPEAVIQWLIVEHYFFANGLADEARDYLTTFGFLKAERTLPDATTPETGDDAPSAASPAPPNSRDDTLQPMATAASSSE